MPDVSKGPKAAPWPTRRLPGPEDGKAPGDGEPSGHDRDRLGALLAAALANLL